MHRVGEKDRGWLAKRSVYLDKPREALACSRQCVRLTDGSAVMKGRRSSHLLTRAMPNPALSLVQKQM